MQEDRVQWVVLLAGPLLLPTESTSPLTGLTGWVGPWVSLL